MRGLLQLLISMAVFWALTPLISQADCDELSSEDVAQLVDQLGSQEFETRARASEELKRHGPESIAAVSKAVYSKDCEVSYRCVKLLQHWLESDDSSIAPIADGVLKDLETSDKARLSYSARVARRNSPERVIERLETLGARFTYESDQKVTGIDLSRQGVSNRDVASLHKFHEVETIDLDYTEITSEVFSSFQKFSQLRELRLRCDCLNDDHLQFLKPLSSLEVLNLWRTGLTDRGLEHLPPLTHLKELNLGHNCITDEGLQHLAGMKELTGLNLIRTGISDRGLQTLAALPSLENLDVRGTDVTASGIEELQRRHPDLHIRFCPAQTVSNCHGKENCLTPLRPDPPEPLNAIE